MTTAQSSSPSSPTPSTASPNSAAPALTTPSVADDLGDLARNPALKGRRAELESLANALRQQTDLDRWAATDLFATFLQEESFRRPLLTWIGRIVDIIVQALFFMPILFTWFGLLEATRAYRDTVHLKAVANESFIQGWQNGFDGHLSRGFYLDDIARDVVILIALLVVLMFVQSMFRSLFEEDQAAKLRLDLVKAIAAADLELAPYRSSAPGQATTELRTAAAEIKKTANAIRGVGDTARQTQTAAKASLDAAANGVAMVSAAVSKVDALALAVTAAAGQAGSASAALEQRMADMNATTSAVVAAQTELASKIAQAGAQLTSSADDLVNRLSDAVRASQQGMASAADGLVSRLSDAVRANQQGMASAADASAAKIVTALETGAGQIRSALTEISVAGAGYAHRVEQAADIIGQAGDSVNALPGLIANFQAGVSDLGNRLSDLEQAITLARTAVPRPDDIPPGFRDALTELRAAADALASASAALLRLGRRSQARQATIPSAGGSSAGAPGTVISLYGTTDTAAGPDSSAGPGGSAGQVFDQAPPLRSRLRRWLSLRRSVR